jgi:hypothetical protein
VERKDPLLGLAERVAEEARALGIETALIGAAALAIHGYTRATLDLDLASAVDPSSDLRALEMALQRIGLHTKLNMPDAEDALGGVLNVWEGEDDDVEPVQIVNFRNPHRPMASNPGAEAIRTAFPLEHSSLRCVRLPELIALKLYADSPNDDRDVVEILEKNREGMDVEEIEAVCARYGFAERLEQLLLNAGIATE